MKRFYPLFFLLFFISSGLCAQTENNSNNESNETLYTIVYAIHNLQDSVDANVIIQELLTLKFVQSAEFLNEKNTLQVFTYYPSNENKIQEVIRSCYRILGYILKIELLEIR